MMVLEEGGRGETVGGGLGTVILCGPILYACCKKLLLTLDVFLESKIRH